MNVFFLIGVAGSGKTTIGKLLSEQWKLPFYDGDDFHPHQNKEKMASGQPLDDRDREGWLQAIHDFVCDTLPDTSLIVACSALKETYRTLLKKDIESQCRWIHLHAPYEVIFERMNQRKDHFMPPDLLRSQFDILEPPTYGLSVDVSHSPEAAVAHIISTYPMPAEFGVIGLGVMGSSLSRNLGKQGVRLSLYNQRVPGKEEKVAEQLISTHEELRQAQGFEDLAAFVQSLATPRKIFLMVKAGAVVDHVIDQLVPLLSAGDIIIDGGNSHYKDTQRRIRLLSEKNLHFIGTGVSGGEEGALTGPSIMVGGDREACSLVMPYLQQIAAKDPKGGTCCAYIGKEGAGHFVKMVHNGIEYAEMQLIAEVYTLLRNGANQTHEAIATLFESWLDTGLRSYLLEITIQILRKKENDQLLLDAILDKAGNKGTGNWTVISACEQGVPISTISAALFARYQSTFKEQRVAAGAAYDQAYKKITSDAEALRQAYSTSRIINHHQGFHLIQDASETYGWNINLSELARIWTNGCIIRSNLMQRLITLFKEENQLLMHPKIRKELDCESLEKSVSGALHARVPVPALSASLQYFHTYTEKDSAANLIQAQRDYFGAHTYQRKDDPNGPFHHTIWSP